MKQLVLLNRIIAEAKERGHDLDLLLVEPEAVCYLEDSPGEEEPVTIEDE